MYKTEVDVKQLLAVMNDTERRVFPKALVRGLNDAAFDVRAEWQRGIGSVFDRPTPLTLNAVLVRKATLDEPYAEVFLRDEASKGTPPVKYLVAEVIGGPRRPKAFERRLRAAGVLAGNEFAVPASGMDLDAYGNVPGSLYQTMLSDLGAQADPQRNSTAKTRRNRNRSKKKEFGSFFVSSPALSASQGHHQPLPKGIYQRRSSRFTGPTRGAVRMVFAIVKQPAYTKRFDPVKFTTDVFQRQFPRRFRDAMFYEQLRKGLAPA